MKATPQAGQYTALSVSRAELELLEAAVDSYIYWQLSDVQYRNDGAVWPPGSDDPETAEQIMAADELGAALQEALALQSRAVGRKS